MNTYSKYVPNVFLAKCPEKHEKGDVIPVCSKYGKENDSIVFNLIYERDGFYYYSIVRADGYNLQERAKNKAEKYSEWAQAAEKKSDEYYNKSKSSVAGITMGQPILVGHHSEGRHRRDLEKSWNAMGKSVEMSDKAESHESKADYWAKRANDINLSIPESVEFYAYKLEIAKEYHEGVKSGIYKRDHSFTLQYAKKEVNDLTEKAAISKKLWG